MTGEVSVNGVAVDVAAFPSPEAAAARELLRQQALATGMLEGDADAGEIDGAIERLLEREVSTPEPSIGRVPPVLRCASRAFRSRRAGGGAAHPVPGVTGRADTRAARQGRGDTP